MAADKLLLLLASLFCGAVVTLAMPVSSDLHNDFRYPDTYQETDTNRFNRESGLGSLLMKNLRFRDLSDVSGESDNRWPASFPAAQPTRRHAPFYKRDGLPGLSAAKRQIYSMSELAQLLSSLKEVRDTDGDGVKLQSLRFGK